MACRDQERELCLPPAGNWRKTFLYFEDAGATPQSLVGWTFTAKIKGTSAGTIDLTAGNGRLEVDTAAGRVTMKLSAAEVATVTQAHPEYELCAFDTLGVMWFRWHGPLRKESLLIA